MKKHNIYLLLTLALVFTLMGCTDSTKFEDWMPSHTAQQQQQPEPEQPQKGWKNLLVNGDAEKSWAELGLANVAYDDMENNYKVCAWGRERLGTPEDPFNPHPAVIEKVDGNNVFVVHGSGDATEIYQNQFWIQTPQKWELGTRVKVHFRYKASQATTVRTEIHRQTPGDFYNYDGIGIFRFTTEWKECDVEFVINEILADGWSIAFDLNDGIKTATDFYFDDLEWSIKDAITPNPSELIIYGKERDELSENGGTGEIWDNQFFIVANRSLKTGESTIIEFDYMSSHEANTSTYLQAEPGEYLTWNAIGDVLFTPEWQHFSKELIVPIDADGMKTIVFNMAVEKEACDYHLKNIVWKLADDSESLIDMEGTKNFQNCVIVDW